MEIFLTILTLIAIFGVFALGVYITETLDLDIPGVIVTGILIILAILALAGVFPLIWGAGYFGIA